MNQTKDRIRLEPSEGFLRAGWRALRAAAGVSIVLASGLVAVGQETNTLNPTNATALTNLTAEAGAGTNAVANTNAAAFTNGTTQTNTAVLTNTVVQTNDTVSTNDAAQTNSMADMNAALSLGTNVEQAGVSNQFTSASRLDYPSFRMITDRNIFNPNRSSRSTRTSERREYRRPARVESFSLVGTMTYDKGPFAFFDGSSYQFKKAVRPNETIASFKLLEVLHDKVKLAAGTNVIELTMGTQMRREDEGSWRLATGSESYSISAPATLASTTSSVNSTNIPSEAAAPGSEPATASGASTNSQPTAASSGSESDVLKRLMERREKEMNK